MRFVNCDAGGDGCSVTLGANSGTHRLQWIEAPSSTSEELASRFLLQATMGPTRPAIRNLTALNATSTSDGILQWLSAQMQLPPSLHRAYWRRRANPRLRTAVGSGGLREACHLHSRWHR